MQPGDVTKAAREGTLRGRPPDELKDMLKSIVCYQANHPNDPQAAYAIMAIRGELESLEISVRHQAMVEEQQRLRGSVDTLVSGQSTLKRSVDRLHCVDIANCNFDCWGDCCDCSSDIAFSWTLMRF